MQPCPNLDGQRLEDSRRVWRFVKLTALEQVSADGFVLRKNEARSDRPWLSVFDIDLATFDQALAIAGDYDAGVDLSVGDIHALKALNSQSVAHQLAVLWHCLMVNGKQDPRPGAMGHAGIEGTLQPVGHEGKPFRDLRQFLADLANDPDKSRIELVPDREGD